MNKKKRDAAMPGKRATKRQSNDAAFLAFLGLNAQLAAELRYFYDATLSEPLPEQVGELLGRLSKRRQK
jgi:hypothetical protein